MNQTKVKDLVDEALALNETLFLIDLSISVNNKIQITVDGVESGAICNCAIKDYDKKIVDIDWELFGHLGGPSKFFLAGE